MSGTISPNQREVLYALGLTSQPEKLLSTNGALDVYIAGGSSSGTQYAELATTSPGTGTLSLGRYKASAPTLTDGQMYGLQLDSSGNLKVSGSLSVGGTTDNSAFTAGTSTGTPAMGFYHSTIDAVTDGRSAALAIDAKRNLFTVLRDAAGNARGVNVDANNNAQVILASNTGVDIGKLTANQSVNISQIAGGTAINSGVTGALAVGGDTASGATDAGNPVKVGGRYNSTKPSLTDGQRADLQLSTRGAALVQLMANDSNNALLIAADNADGVVVSATSNKLTVISRATVFNGTSWDRQATVINATNSTGAGITAAGILAQFDDVSPTAITENQFGNLRMSANRNLYGTIRDAAGNERGLNIDANGALAATVTNATASNLKVDISGSAANSTAGLISVKIDQTTVGTTNAVSLAQVGATTVATGNGVVGAGVQRVAIASDNTAFSVNATLSAETTKVIGVVRTADGAGNLYTTNSTTYTAKFAQDGNLLGTLGTAFSTAGKVDVKGADGDVFVRQATGTNLHTVLDSGTLTTLTTLTGTTTLTPGTGATNLGKAEDAAHTTGDTGVYVMGTRQDAPTSTAGTSGDYQGAAFGAEGGQWSTLTPSTQGGLTTYHLVSAASTNATNIKASAGQVYGWYIYNSNAAARKLAFHNTAGTPTAGAAIFFAIVIPPSAGANVEFTNGIPFSTGIAITTVTGLADNDGTAVALNDLVINLFYK